MTVPDAQRVAAVRRFNRFYTQHLGVLGDGWLDSPFSLTEARVLYEIKVRDRATATGIARDLGLDAGYLSRILRRFHKSNLIRKDVSPDDGRQSFLSITAAGRKAFAPLEARTQRQVGAMLGPLTAPEQDRLVSAMRAIESMITPSPAMTEEIVLRQPGPGDLGWVVARHAELYAQEYGWAENFEGICAQIVADFVSKLDPDRERCWIAEMDGRNVGCAFLVKDSATVARLRLLLVDPAARGRGLGHKLTDECIRFARRSGYKGITLWTHSVLTAARHIYRKAGFRLTSSEKRKNFGKDVVSEHWDLEF
ncbi:MAG: bifunctional helix-turn-helix transcriptional regulator/GNAT family N-acetyltransferase [Alphaproteobacteria bacterium]|nr:bifunctional helix-turn-helix transcriptional regulator/GNAT family N-acetyltransferase [Alphaproteobacteria bacterium]